jgi:hypothetical protein
MLRVTGTVDDRFSQRTIRTDASGVQAIGSGSDPDAQAATTGGIGESLEGELVEVSGAITTAPTTLTSAIAVDLDDGSGAIRVLVGNTTGIDTSGWIRGASLRLRGAVGQRDSSGSGTAGYRVQPRDQVDIIGFAPPATPTPMPSSSASGSPSPSPSDVPGVISIAAARGAPTNARVTVRGVVTLPANMAEEGTAAIQDSSGAILLRLGEESRGLALGDLVEVSGTRSTKAGMETIRIVDPATRLGHQAQPDPRRRATGSVGEADEAMLVIVRGQVTLSPRRTSAENIYFDVDDGSGPLRVFVSPRSRASAEGIVIGSWIEVAGVLGQETTGKLPDRGYRLWPRIAADLRIVASATGPDGSAGGSAGTFDGDGEYSPSQGGSEPSSGDVGPAGSLAAQQGVPRLAAQAAIATGSRRPVQPGRIRAAASDGDQPVPLGAAAGLLALGGLLLTGSGMLVLPPGRAGQLIRALRDRLRSSAQEDAAGGAGQHGTMGDPMPALVPLTVLDGPRAAGERAQRDSRSGGERILPPT